MPPYGCIVAVAAFACMCQLATGVLNEGAAAPSGDVPLKAPQSPRSRIVAPVLRREPRAALAASGDLHEQVFMLSANKSVPGFDELKHNIGPISQEIPLDTEEPMRSSHEGTEDRPDNKAHSDPADVKRPRKDEATSKSSVHGKKTKHKSQHKVDHNEPASLSATHQAGDAAFDDDTTLESRARRLLEAKVNSDLVDNDASFAKAKFAEPELDSAWEIWQDEVNLPSLRGGLGAPISPDPRGMDPENVHEWLKAVVERAKARTAAAHPPVQPPIQAQSELPHAADVEPTHHEIHKDLGNGKNKEKEPSKAASRGVQHDDNDAGDAPTKPETQGHKDDDKAPNIDGTAAKAESKSHNDDGKSSKTDGAAAKAETQSHTDDDTPSKTDGIASKVDTKRHKDEGKLSKTDGAAANAEAQNYKDGDTSPKTDKAIAKSETQSDKAKDNAAKTKKGNEDDGKKKAGRAAEPEPINNDDIKEAAKMGAKAEVHKFDPDIMPKRDPAPSAVKVDPDKMPKEIQRHLPSGENHAIERRDDEATSEDHDTLDDAWRDDPKTTVEISPLAREPADQKTPDENEEPPKEDHAKAHHPSEIWNWDALRPKLPDVRGSMHKATSPEDIRHQPHEGPPRAPQRGVDDVKGKTDGTKMASGLKSDDAPATCQDVDAEATDKFGFNCASINGKLAAKDFCNYHSSDDDDFSRSIMCCACGGGVQVPQDQSGTQDVFRSSDQQEPAADAQVVSSKTRSQAAQVVNAQVVKQQEAKSQVVKQQDTKSQVVQQQDTKSHSGFFKCTTSFGQASNCPLLGGGGGNTIQSCGNLMRDLGGDTFNFQGDSGECNVKACGSADLQYATVHVQIDVYSRFCAAGAAGVACWDEDHQGYCLGSCLTPPGRQTAGSIFACQQLCYVTEGCSFFTYSPDHTCWLKSQKGVLAPDHETSGIKLGPRSCNADQAATPASDADNAGREGETNREKDSSASDKTVVDKVGHDGVARDEKTPAASTENVEDDDLEDPKLAKAQQHVEKDEKDAQQERHDSASTTEAPQRLPENVVGKHAETKGEYGAEKESTMSDAQPSRAPGDQAANHNVALSNELCSNLDANCKDWVSAFPCNTKFQDLCPGRMEYQAFSSISDMCTSECTSGVTDGQGRIQGEQTTPKATADQGQSQGGQATPDQKGFMVGSEKTNSCPEGGVAITDETQCMQAAKFLDFHYVDFIATPIRPKGCYVNGVVSFNADERGSAQPGFQPICEAGAVATSGGPVFDRMPMPEVPVNNMCFKEVHAKPQSIVHYSGSLHNCSTASGFCYWTSEESAKASCSDWSECEVLYCTGRGSSSKTVCFAAKASTWVEETSSQAVSFQKHACQAPLDTIMSKPPNPVDDAIRPVQSTDPLWDSREEEHDTPWRCGLNHTDNGLGGKCASWPSSDGFYYSCCSARGWCGNTHAHCSCSTCIDYKEEIVNPEAATVAATPEKNSSEEDKPEAANGSRIFLVTLIMLVLSGVLAFIAWQTQEKETQRQLRAGSSPNEAMTSAASLAATAAHEALPSSAMAAAGSSLYAYTQRQQPPQTDAQQGGYAARLAARMAEEPQDGYEAIRSQRVRMLGGDGAAPAASGGAAAPSGAGALDDNRPPNDSFGPGPPHRLN